MSKRLSFTIPVVFVLLASALTAAGFQIRPDIRARSENLGVVTSISATPSPLDLGPVNVGSSGSASVTITNTSAGTVTLNTPFTITGADALQFTVGAPVTTVIAAGGSTTASVSFLPTTGGPKTATLNITATDGSLAQVTLQGTGIVVGPTAVVISQVYGGAGCGTVGCSTYKNDYIEIYNQGTTPQSLNGWSVQYASATGTTWQVTNLTNVTLQGGQFYLVAESAGANGINNIPTADATGSIAMSATAGKVALVIGTSPLSGACPASVNIVDLVGYGTTANCFEGGAAAPAPSTANADIRNGLDTNNNNTDFTAAAATPHNSLTPTAEEVSISGRILTAAGEGIPGAPVTVSGGGLTSPTSVRASATGDYRFDRLRPGLTYIISVRAKHYVFTNPARPVLVTDDVANFDFIAQP